MDYNQSFTVVVFAYEDQMEEKLPKFGANEKEKELRVSSVDELPDKLQPSVFKKSKSAISAGFEITKKVRK